MKILIVGDSFTYGHGCSDRNYWFSLKENRWFGENFNEFGMAPPSQHCWASLLAQHLPEFEVINLAVPGNNATTMAIETLKKIDKNVKLVIFSGPPSARIEIVSHDGTEQNVISWLVTDNSINQERQTRNETNHSPILEDVLNAKLAYMKYLHSDVVTANLAITAAHASCYAALNVGAHFLWSFPNTDVLISDSRYEAELSGIRKYEIPSANGFFNPWTLKGQPYFAEDGHINDLGHRTYFEQILLPRVEATLWPSSSKVIIPGLRVV